MSGVLYIVATPIGNLEDISARALSTLRSVDVVFAEDTRVTKKIFARYAITTAVYSYHQRSGVHKTDEVIAVLSEGKSVALVTDAGTPGISDPGNELIDRVLAAIPDLRIEPIPGASSVTAALSVCGFRTSEFVFFGFLPHKKGRKTKLDEVAKEERTVILFESPHRIGKLLAELTERSPERKIAVFRELTKMHESSYRGTVEELHNLFTRGEMMQKGEFVVVLGPI